MASLFQSGYYWLDLLLGFGSPVALFLLIRLGRVPARDWKLFWVGAAIGLTWEIPIFLLSRLSNYPIIAWIREPPVHYSVYLVCHTLWDGALFVTGVWLAALFCHRPVLAKFRWCELAVLVAWGQITAFLVEFSAVTNQAWTYLDGIAWNPTMLTVGDYPITWMMQVVWLAATIAFYPIALKIAAPKTDQS